MSTRTALGLLIGFVIVILLEISYRAFVIQHAVEKIAAVCQTK